MKKSTLFIVCLLLIVVAEVVMLFKHGIGGASQNYVLDSKVYDMPVREAEVKVVKPEPMQLHTSSEVDAILDEFAADISRSMAQKSAEANEQLTADVQVEPELISPELVEAAAEINGTPEMLIPEVEELLATDIKEIEKTAAEQSEEAVEPAEVENELEPESEVVEVLDGEKNTPDTEENMPDEAEILPAVVEESASVSQEPVVNEAKAEPKYKIAIVIDDVGLSVPFTKEIKQLKAPLTVSLLPYGASDKKQATELKNVGFEVMLHVPMMPHVPAALAPITLSPEMDKVETQGELSKMIERFAGSGMDGINNHMGSLLTERTKNMGYVMEVLKKHGMFFLDSKTTNKSAAKKAADEYGVAYIARDVFLDNKNDYNYILGQFRQAEKVAKKNGYAVAIGHPHSETVKVLRDWLKDAEKRGFEVVHLSDLVKK